MLDVGCVGCRVVMVSGEDDSPRRHTFIHSLSV